MTSRERVLAVFAHQTPDRVPAWCGASEGFWNKAKQKLHLEDEALRVRFGDDFRRVFARDASPPQPLSPGSTYRSIFGVERHGLGYGQPRSHPLQGATLQQVHDYPWPDPEWMDVSKVREQALAWNRAYAILGGDWSPFWHDAIDLLDMENLFLSAYDQPALLDAVLRHVVDYYIQVSQRIFDAAADAIDIFFIGNDFGSQTGPLMSEAMFRRFILPHIRRLVELGHQYRLKVMLHCCGGYEPLIPALIETGLDGLHALQSCCQGMDLACLKGAFGKKIVLNGAIDSQHILLSGTPESVRESTRKVLEIMMPGGNYIAGASHDWILEETPVENVLSMFDAIREFGVYA